MRSLERFQFNLPEQVLPEVKAPEIEKKSTEELMAEFLDYQKKMEEIAAELKRREMSGEHINSDEQLVLKQSEELAEVGRLEEIKVGKEDKVEEFTDQRPAELEERIAGSDYKKRTFEFLEKEGVVKYKAGQVYFDLNIFEDKEFFEKFRKTYFGKKDGVNKLGSRIEVLRMFEGVKVIGLSENFLENDKPQELNEFIYNNSLEKIKNRFLSELKNEKIIEDKDGLIVFDIDKFNNHKFKYVLGEVDYKVIHSNRSGLYDLLKDLKVVSLNDYISVGEDKDKLKPISLLNVPESAEELSDSEKIKNKEYYINFWELRGQGTSHNPVQWGQGIKARNNEELDLREIYLATKIFRDFNGNRENGVLMVDNPVDGSRQKINFDWITKNVGRIPGISNGIHSFLRDNCPNLLKSGLLEYNDFRIMKNKDEELVVRKEYYPTEGKKMEVFWGKVKYYIAQKDNFIFEGRRIPTKNIKVSVLDGKTLGIISTVGGVEKLEYTIDMLNEQEIKEKLQVLKNKAAEGKLIEETITKGVVANRDDLEGKIKEFNFSSLIMRKANESEEDYSRRASRVLDYNHVKDVSDNLLNECKVSIHNLSWREQVWLSAAEHELRLQNRYDEFIKFVDDYKLEGLKTFLSCENDIDDSVRIMEISKKLGKEDANRVYGKVAELTDLVNKTEDVLGQDFLKGDKKVDYDYVKLELLKKSHEILLAFSDDLPVGKDKVLLTKSLDLLLNNLQEINGEILLLNNVLSQLSREEIAQINLREIKNIERREDMNGAEVLEEQALLIKIKEIIKAQFPAGDEDVFVEECSENKNLKITVTMANGEVLSFFSKEKISGNIEYIDWFLANPNAPVKGLGEATARLGFGEDDLEQSYYAVAKPHAKSFGIFIEKLGFTAFDGSTRDDEYKHHYARVRKFPEDKKFVSKNISDDVAGDFKNRLVEICPDEFKTESIIWQGNRLLVSKIKYNGKTHLDDIKKTDPEGWLFKEMERLGDQYVLTRFIPETNEKNNQTFYAVFEKDLASSDLKSELDEALLSRSSSHSDSKKALSS